MRLRQSARAAQEAGFRATAAELMLIADHPVDYERGLAFRAARSASQPASRPAAVVTPSQRATVEPRRGRPSARDWWDREF